VTRIEIHIAIKSMCYTGKPLNWDTELTQIIFLLKRSYRTRGYISVQIPSEFANANRVACRGEFQWLQKSLAS